MPYICPTKAEIVMGTSFDFIFIYKGRIIEFRLKHYKRMLFFFNYYYYSFPNRKLARFHIFLNSSLPKFCQIPHALFIHPTRVLGVYI